MIQTSYQDVVRWVREITTCTSFDAVSIPLLKPYHLLTLALELKRRGRHGNVPQLPSELQNYAARMKLWEAAGISPSSLINENSSTGKFLPVIGLIDYNVVNQVASELIIAAKKNFGDMTTVDSLGTMLIELLGNYYAHSDSSSDQYGLVCAQSWLKGNLAQIALIDSGIGIRTSLHQNPELVNELKKTNACELACKYGVTGKPKGSHSGYGLTLARQLMAGNAGNFILISNNEGFVQNANGIQRLNDLPEWKGTMLILEWNTSKPFEVNVGDVYAGWPMPKGFTPDDFF